MCFRLEAIETCDSSLGGLGTMLLRSAQQFPVKTIVWVCSVLTQTNGAWHVTRKSIFADEIVKGIAHLDMVFGVQIVGR